MTLVVLVTEASGFRSNVKPLTQPLHILNYTQPLKSEALSDQQIAIFQQAISLKEADTIPVANSISGKSKRTIIVKLSTPSW